MDSCSAELVADFKLQFLFRHGQLQRGGGKRLQVSILFPTSLAGRFQLHTCPITGDTFWDHTSYALHVQRTTELPEQSKATLTLGESEGDEGREPVQVHDDKIGRRYIKSKRDMKYERIAVFEAVHGTAPDIEQQKYSNTSIQHDTAESRYSSDAAHDTAESRYSSGAI